MIRNTQDGDTWTVTIDRPDKAGALTHDMLAELADIAQAAQKAKLFILTSAGSVFSAGADLDAMQDGLATDPVWERLSQAIIDLPGLSIAALNGTVAGGAFGMVLACDLRVAVPRANFFYPVMKRGFLPQPSDPQRMANLIGAGRAKHILMAGQKISAAQALNWGLIDAIAEGDTLMSTVSELSQDALNADISHITAIKRMIT